MTLKMKDASKIPESWKTFLDPVSFAYWHMELEQS
jgi:hypothetical protein